MKITRDVILDLLPLYIANELSEDTRALIDEYLDTDPEIAKIALKEVIPGLMSELPVPLNKENKMKSYLEAKKIMNQRIATIAISIIVVLAFLAVAFLFLFRAM